MTNTLTWLGHAALQLQIGETFILVDPYLSGNPQAAKTAAEVQADYILVTHGHGDHVGDTVAIAKRTGATAISNAEISTWLAKQGIKTHGQHLGGGFKYPFGYLKMTFALHGSALPDGSYGGNPGGFLLTTPDGKKVYMAGDTGLFGDMQLIGAEGLDLAVLPIGDNYTMGPEDALKAVKSPPTKSGHSDPLKHFSAHPAGCRCVGNNGGKRNQHKCAFAETRSEYRILAVSIY